MTKFKIKSKFDKTKKKSNCNKLISLNCDKTQKLKIWKDSTQIVTKLKNLNCNRTQKLEFRQNWTQSLTNFKNSNGDKIQQLKLWQNSTTQTVTKLITSNCYPKKNFWQQAFVKNNLTPQ